MEEQVYDSIQHISNQNDVIIAIVRKLSESHLFDFILVVTPLYFFLKLYEITQRNKLINKK